PERRPRAGRRRRVAARPSRGPPGFTVTGGSVRTAAMADQAIEPGVLLADRQRHWTYRLPPRLRDLALLARWDRPIGTWLLLLPCWWGLALAGPAPARGLWLAILFAVGAVAMRGAGCTINDLADRKFDAKVARTANR